MPRYLGDMDTKILHDLRRECPQCKLNSIIKPAPFKTFADGIHAGLRPCEHCCVFEIEEVDVSKHGVGT